MAVLGLSNRGDILSSSSNSLEFYHKIPSSFVPTQWFPPRTRRKILYKRQHFSISSSLSPKNSAKIKVIGVGGGGNNAVNRMIGSGLQGVDFYAINTDTQALSQSTAENPIQIGELLTRGLGTGGNPLLGEQAAEESKEGIANALKGSDMVFITAGMGGALKDAKDLCRQVPFSSSLKKLIIVVPCRTSKSTVSIPSREGVDMGFTIFVCFRGWGEALEAIEKLQKNVDTLIVIHNDRLLDIADEQTPLQNAFLLADDVLCQGVQGISDIITIPGLVNVDFADVKAIMKNSGTAMLGVGASSSRNRAEEAAEQATLAPLIGSSIQSATGIVYNITGGKDITLQEVNRVSQVVTSLADPSANIIFGAVVDERFNGEIHVTIIATGFTESFQNTLLTNPRGAKLVDNSKGTTESTVSPDTLSSSNSPSTKPQPPARNLFF
uniref:FtsZ 2 n=1 Tax=Solanum tuberosum TaxID=4113 RepID=M1AZ49_SOLTU